MKRNPFRESSEDVLPPHEQLRGRILVVDDDLPNRVMLRKLLKEQGCEVLEAEDGEQALLIIQQELPDLALVDVMMPGMSGYEVCRRIKEDALMCDVSVILVTARRVVEDVERGFDLGSFDYIRKPYNSRELLARVRNALALKRSRDELLLWQRRMSRELEIAGSLQRKLFSTRPFFGPDFEVHMAYRPSQTVGGDLFDAMFLPDGSLCVYAGDVAGHGVAPAMVSSLLKGVITEAARITGSSGPAAVCRQIDASFAYHVENPELYATLFLAILDWKSNRWVCMNCGHPQALLLNQNGEWVRGALTSGGDLPIGINLRQHNSYPPESETSAPAELGSVLFLYTDGLLEARHRATGELCGMEHLETALRRALAGDYVPNPADRVFALLKEDGYDLSGDDSSALIVLRYDPASNLLNLKVPLDLKAISNAASDVDVALRSNGWSEESSGAAQLAVMEYGTNIIQHSRPPSGSTIDIQVRLIKSVCRIVFKDRGTEWDLNRSTRALRNAPQYREDGRGLFILHAITSHIEVHRRGDENIGVIVVPREYNPRLGDVEDSTL